MASTKTNIKKFILRKTIRFVNGQIAKNKREVEIEVLKIFEDYGLGKAVTICAAMERAFQLSKCHHKERLSKKLDHTKKKKKKKKKRHLPSLCEKRQTRNNMITDLTGTLTQNECELLAKGPKFAISNSIQELNIKANFCQLAYQLRWQQHMQ